MTLMLGIDTGGTFTDAVVVTGEAAEVVATAKAPTTHGDLVVGIEAVLRTVVAQPGVTVGAIGLVSLSTTLATNALVEGQGEPACLITAGFGPAEVARIGIGPGHHDLVVPVSGGHDALGRELAPVDPGELARVAADTMTRVSAYAVATQFSVRNPAHELAIAETVEAVSGRPVTCSHELSPRLNGPRRALTTLLNARLIGIMAQLEAAVRTALATLGIDAPLMMVRGDGSLASASFVARRPIETILSGPAASVIGTRHLAGALDGLVVDIGGTTTDIAAVRSGWAALASDGALVAGHRTMVETVDLTTHGLGGDSEVAIDTASGDGSPAFTLGPARALPLSRLALDHPGALDVLRRQLAARPVHGQGRLLMAVGPGPGGPQIEGRERAVLDALADGPAAEVDVASNGLAARAVGRLRRHGLVRVATFTPTDAAVILGHLDHGSVEAAALGAELLARQLDPRGHPVAASGRELAERVEEHLIDRSVACVLEAALRGDGLDGPGVMAGPLVPAALSRHRGLVALSVELTGPVAAVGASAATYYPRVAGALGTTVVLPPHGAVANAVGAAVGRIRIRRQVTISQPRTGSFRVHAGPQPVFHDLDEARAWADDQLGRQVGELAVAAGAAEVEVAWDWAARTAHVNGRPVLVEGTAGATATGRPQVRAGEY